MSLVGAGPSIVSAEDQIVEHRLADNVVEATHPNGRTFLKVGDTRLEDRTPPREPPPAHVTIDDRRRGYILYRRASDQVFRLSSPRVHERVASLFTAISLGEKRHVQFAVYALGGLEHIDVSADPLARREGIALPPASLTIRPVRVGYWRNYWDPWYQKAPKLIHRPDAKTDVKHGESQQFWITVAVPENAQPGEYHTKIRIAPARGEPAELPLSIEVLPFKLAPGRWWGVYYYPGFNDNTPRDFADMKAHGVNSMLICPPGAREPVLERRGESVVASFPLTDKAMAELQRQGFDRPVAYFPRLLSCRLLYMFGRVDGERIKSTTYYGTQAAQYKAEDYPEDLKGVLKDLFRQMVQHAQDADWPPILWLLVDEPGAAAGHSMEMEWARLEFALFAESCPDEKLLCTAYSKQAAEVIGVPLDVRVCNMWRIGPNDVAEAAEQSSELWAIRWLCQYNTYRFPRHYAGFGLDRMGIHGFTEWTYYGAPHYRPFDQVQSHHGCHYAFVGDDDDQLLTTITWEATQEGIDDARYTATLKTLIEQARASDAPGHQTLADSAEAALRDIHAQIVAATATNPEAQLDDMRRRIAGQIMRFISAGLSPTDHTSASGLMAQ